MHRGGEAEGRGQRWGGFVLALLAVVLLALSVFMPKLDSATIRLHQNRLIDGWEGAALMGYAALIVLGASLGLWRRQWGWLDCATGVATLGVVIYASTGSRLIVQAGGIGGEAPVRGVAGLGLVVAGLGALVAVGAGLLIGLSREAPAGVP